jgi:hypothetical protein
MGVIGMGLLIALPLLSFEPIKMRVEARADTFTALEDNGSAQARVALYTGHGPRQVLSNPLGVGMGSVGKVASLGEDGIGNFDSGVLGVPLVLGIPGMLVYYYGLGVLIVRYMWRRHYDRFLWATSSLALSIMALLVFANQLKGLSGIILWVCLGLTFASHMYHGNRGVSFD